MLSNLPSLAQTKIIYGMTVAKKIIAQNAIKKTNKNIRNPRNFIIINFAGKETTRIKTIKTFYNEI